MNWGFIGLWLFGWGCGWLSCLAVELLQKRRKRADQRGEEWID